MIRQIRQTFPLYGNSLCDKRTYHNFALIRRIKLLSYSSSYLLHQIFCVVMKQTDDNNLIEVCDGVTVILYIHPIVAIN